MNLIDDILNSVDIVDIISNYVDLKKSWRNFVGLCPFHSEKTPSFVVSPDKQIFKCFWCWKGWNVITFIKEIENVDFFDAIKILAEKAWIDIKKYKTNFWNHNSEINTKEELLKINKAALNFFHKNIFENEKALSYLVKERKLSKELIIKYKLWYAPAESNKLINYLLDKGFSQEVILKSGLWKQSSSWSIYSFFTNRIIFPIFNQLGEIVAFSWRIFDNQTTWWKYINTPETILYHKSNILYNYHNAKKTKKNYIIVCEGYMDVIWLDRLGYDNAVATCGTALTPQHIKLLKRITSNIVFAFDSDEAWKQASLRWLQIALENWVYPKVFNIPEWKDFDELANLKENDEKFKNDLEIQIKNSPDWVSFFIDNILENYKTSSPTQKESKLQQIFDILKKITNYSIFWDYLEYIGNKINIHPNILYQQFKKLKTYKKPENISETNNKNDYIIPSLFYNDFYEKFKIEKITDLLEIIFSILDFLPEQHLLKKVFTNQVSFEEKEKILQSQLQWEENLHWRTKEKINNKLLNEVKIYLIHILMELIKSPSIETDKKANLMIILNQLRKFTI